MRTCAVPALGGILLWLLASGPAGAQTYREEFAQGMKARNRQDWDAAFDHARRALADRSAAEAKRIEIEGIGSVPYTPYLLLGIAAHHRADCNSTVQAYVASVAQRVGPALAPEDFARLREGREACAAAGDPAQLAAADAVAEALVAYASVDALRSADLEAHWKSDPRWQETFAEATRQLEFGHNLLVLSVQGTGAAEDLQSAAAMAQRARNQFRTLDKTIGDAAVRRANSSISTAWDRSDEVDIRRREAGPAWSSKPGLEKSRSDAVSSIQRAESELGAALGPERTPRALEAAELASQAEAELSAVLSAAADLTAPRRAEPSPGSEAANERVEDAQRPTAKVAERTEAAPDAAGPGSEPALPSPVGDEVAPGGPDESALRAAAAAYFRGDYQAALDELRETGGSEAMQLQAHLLRAAASFALSRLEGSEHRLEEARAEIGELLALDAAFRPPELYFSPAFRQLFER